LNYVQDALNYIEQIQSKLAILKTEEKQLFDDLAVFEMKYIYSIEMSELQEVRNIILKKRLKNQYL